MTSTTSSRLYCCLLALLFSLFFTQQLQAEVIIPQPGLGNPYLVGGNQNTDHLLLSSVSTNGVLGMSVTGPYSFNATGNYAAFGYTAFELISPGNFNYTVDSSIQASFSSNDPNSNAYILGYEEDSYLFVALDNGHGTLIEGGQVTGFAHFCIHSIK